MQYKLPDEIKKLVEDAKSRCQSTDEVHNLMNSWSVQTILGHVHHMETQNSEMIRGIFLLPYYSLLASTLQSALIAIIYNRHMVILKDSRKAEKQSKEILEEFWNDVMSFSLFKKQEDDKKASKKK